LHDEEGIAIQPLVRLYNSLPAARAVGRNTIDERTASRRAVTIVTALTASHNTDCIDDDAAIATGDLSWRRLGATYCRQPGRWCYTSQL